MGVTRLQKTLFAVIILPFLFPIFSTSTSILLPTEVNISSVHHFTSDYVFISDITDAVKSKDNLWCEDINPTDILRVTYESNLTI